MNTTYRCGAEILGEVMKIKGGQFTKEESTRAPFEAKINGNKAVLEIGKVYAPPSSYNNIDRRLLYIPQGCTSVKY